MGLIKVVLGSTSGLLEEKMVFEFESVTSG
jgi:hypothetical protein